MNGLSVMGDTLWVIDGGLRRATAIDGDLALLETWEYPQFPVRSPYSLGLVLTRLRDGRLLSMASHAADNSNVLVSVDPDGSLRVLAVVGMARGHYTISVDGRSMPGDLLPNFPSFAVSPDGSRVVVVRNYVDPDDRTGTLEVVAVALSGDTIFHTGHAFVPRPLPAEAADSIIEFRTGVLPSDLASAFRREVRIPETYPPVGEVLFTTEGGVWIEVADARENHDYLVLDSAGRARGAVAVPDGVRVRAIAGSTIWGTDVDSLGVPSVVRFELTEARPEVRGR